MTATTMELLDARALATSVPPTLVNSGPCLALRIEDGRLLLAVPAESPEERRTDICTAVRRALDIEVDPVLVPEAELREMVSIYYTTAAVSVVAAEDVETIESDGPVADLLNTILDRAVRLRASDVHFEPTETDMSVRIRVDGKLETLERIPSELAAPVVSRMKVLARINIVERRRPQDGQFSLTFGERSIDVRMATVATLYGEKVVLRLLDTRRSAVTVTELGMAGEHLKTFERFVQTQYGLIIAAGPTGAGKTTTLHSALRELNSPDRNVVTLEDPVEYVVEGINHIPVVESIGATFSTQLRAILRQDPDIVLVGEMRDAETARIGIQAALAGRLVLTSLHAPDAVGAVYRLFQMDIEAHLIAASLRGVIAQRLLRRNCAYCAYKYEANASELLLLNRDPHEKVMLTRGAGCSMCRGTGYRDRIGLFQMLEVTERMRELISKRPDPNQLYALAVEEGLRSLGDEARALALDGSTTASEVAAWVGSDG